jgi:glutamate-1-semialdehyde aminotransferase
MTSYEATLDGADPARFRTFAGALLRAGVHVIPRGLVYVSTAHTDADIAETADRISAAAERHAAEESACTP